MSKNLIIYYSRKGTNYVSGSIRNLPKGNTGVCAELIQKTVGGWVSDIEVSEEVSFEDSPADESIETAGETAEESSAVLFFAPVSL